MERKVYPSDISREQFESIRGTLESARRKTSPRDVDLYDIFCAILYLLKNGCAWRAIPGDFPGWTTVRYYFDQWSQQQTNEGASLLELALKKSSEARTREKPASGEDHVLHRGRAKRENDGQRAAKRL